MVCPALNGASSVRVRRLDRRRAADSAWSRLDLSLAVRVYPGSRFGSTHSAARPSVTAWAANSSPGRPVPRTVPRRTAPAAAPQGLVGRTPRPRAEERRRRLEPIDRRQLRERPAPLNQHWAGVGTRVRARCGARTPARASRQRPEVRVRPRKSGVERPRARMGAGAALDGAARRYGTRLFHRGAGKEWEQPAPFPDEAEIERRRVREENLRRLSYRRAAELFTTATGGATRHQLRHSGLSMLGTSANVELLPAHTAGPDPELMEPLRERCRHLGGTA